jgi:hypothetical protein
LQSLDSIETSAGCHQCGVPGLGSSRGVGVDLPAPRLAEALQGIHDFGKVNPGEFRPGRGSRHDQGRSTRAAGVLEAAPDGIEAVRPFGMASAGEVSLAGGVHLNENRSVSHRP